mgnify:CR=1 FL=1
MQISDQGGEQKDVRFSAPKWIAAAAFSLRVGHQGRDQFQNVHFRCGHRRRGCSASTFLKLMVFRILTL